MLCIPEHPPTPIAAPSSQATTASSDTGDELERSISLESNDDIDIESGKRAARVVNIESRLSNAWTSYVKTSFHDRSSSKLTTSTHSTDSCKGTSLRTGPSFRQSFLKKSKTKPAVQSAKKSWDDKQFCQKSTMNRSASKMVNLNQWPLKRWVKYSVWTVWAMLIMIALGSGQWAFPDGSNPTCPHDDLDKNKATCGVIESLSHASTSLIFLSSFILGGFVLSTRSLWLARRSAYCALCGATRNLLINVTTLLPREDRNTLARWTLLGYELSVLKARSIVETDEGRRYLERSRLLVEDEWDSLVNGDRHTTVWYWIQSRAKELQDEGRINAFELQTVCNAVTLSRDKANDLMSCIDRDQPPPYVFVCALLININLVFHATAKGAEWSAWYHDAGSLAMVFTEPRLYCGIVVMYLFTTIFAMLFDVCALLYNPFGFRDFDIKHNAVGSGIRQLAASLSNGIANPPMMKRLSCSSCQTSVTSVSSTALFDRNHFSLPARERMAFARNISELSLPSVAAHEDPRDDIVNRSLHRGMSLP